jgi:hypothetical protein
MNACMNIDECMHDWMSLNACMSDVFLPLICRWMHAWMSMNACMHACMHAWIIGWMLMNNWMYACMNYLMYACMNYWMYACMNVDELLHECWWMHACMNYWKNEGIYQLECMPLLTLFSGGLGTLWDIQGPWLFFWLVTTGWGSNVFLCCFPNQEIGWPFLL